MRWEVRERALPTSTRPLRLVPVTATRERQSAPSSDNGAPSWSDRSAFGTVQGVPWWSAVLLAVLPTALGTVLDIVIWSKPGWVFTACYIIGCLLAVALVKRRSLFGPMVQPPLVLALVMPLVVLVLGAGAPQGGGGMTKVFAVATPLINGFPTMAITAGVVLGIGLVRMFVLQRADADPDSAADGEAVTKKKATPRTEGRQPRPDSTTKRTTEAGGKRPPEKSARQDPRGTGRPRRGQPGAEQSDDGRQGGRPGRPATGRTGREGKPERGERSVPPGRGGGRQTPPGRGTKPPERKPGGEPPPKRRPRRPRRDDFWD
jgi:hypothetical protein